MNAAIVGRGWHTCQMSDAQDPDRILTLTAGLACTRSGGRSEHKWPEPSESVQLLGLLQGTCSAAVLLAQGLAVPECVHAEAHSP